MVSGYVRHGIRHVDKGIMSNLVAVDLSLSDT